MKRFLSILLALCLVLSLGISVLGAEGDIDTGMLVPGVDAPEVAQVSDVTSDAALTALTAQVKKTLGVDDDYTGFYSDYNDSLTPRWSLNWTDDARQLTCEVTPEGKIVSVSYWADGAQRRDFFNGFDPAFPALGAKEAAEQAEGWYEKLFTGKETGRTLSSRMYLGADGTHRFYGGVDLNGLPSPISFSLSLGADGLESFYRSDSYMGYVGIVPDPTPAAAEADAAKALADALALEAWYVSDGEGGAMLRYMPVGARTVVDAQTGEAVDMDALYAAVGGTAGENGMAMDGAAEMAEPAAGGLGLTQVELSSIENYADVLDQAALDEALRALPGLGLEDFTAERCSYFMSGGEDGGVTADLRYTAPMTADQLYGYDQAAYDQAVAAGQDLTIYKYVTVDAKTGKLLSLYTNYPLWQEDGTVTADREAQAAAAEAFLAAAAPEEAPETALCSLRGYDEKEEIVFAQVHEGYFYPVNCLRVTVNPASGTVEGFSRAWEDVTFGPADAVSAEEALEAYEDALDVTLGYVAWPLDLAREENSLYASYQMWGYTYVEELRLAYYYGNLPDVEAVDAVTGEAIVNEEPEGVYAYDDLEGVPQAEMIAALGEAGVGFDGESFHPDMALTVRDAVVLLLRAGGSHISARDDGALLDQAWYQGLVAEKSWDPDGEMTGADFIRMLLGASRYGDGAALLEENGRDGYMLMAEALSMSPEKPEDTLTRAQAAELLYAFMSR